MANSVNEWPVSIDRWSPRPLVAYCIGKYARGERYHETSSVTRNENEILLLFQVSFWAVKHDLYSPYEHWAVIPNHEIFSHVHENISLYGILEQRFFHFGLSCDFGAYLLYFS